MGIPGRNLVRLLLECGIILNCIVQFDANACKGNRADELFLVAFKLVSAKCSFRFCLLNYPASFIAEVTPKAFSAIGWK